MALKHEESSIGKKGGKDVFTFLIAFLSLDIILPEAT